MSQVSPSPKLGEGYYTVPDAAQILGISAEKLRRWVSGYLKDAERILPMGALPTYGEGKSKGFNFYTLIELFTVMQLRDLGITLKKIREARQELAERYENPFPFAYHGIVSSGKQLLVEIEHEMPDAFLELGTIGQTAFKKVMEPFCKKLDFHPETKLVTRYWPNGKKSSVVVDPHHGYGRPTIKGTNIATETIAQLIRAGESEANIAAMYELNEKQVSDVLKYQLTTVAA